MRKFIQKIKDYVLSLNLTEQFITLIVVVMLAMTLLITIFLNTRVNDFVDTQMYEVIKRSQNSVIHQYITTTEDDPDIFGYTDPSINHFIISNARPIFSNRAELPSETIIASFKLAIKTQEVASDNYKLPTDLGSTPYTVTRINDETALVTTISTTYQNEFKEVLTSTIFYILLVILIVNINIILLWVFSIISPLRKIRLYIDNMGDKKQKTLEIKRNDEIGDVAKALVIMEKEIQRQEIAKTEMIHNISHDLKTPITTIKSYAESIKDGIYPYDTLEKSIDVIYENADRLENKAHSLLLLNRMDYFEDQELEPSCVKMTEIISKVILSIKVIRPEIRIITEVEDVEFNGSEEQWRVCLENLLDNALRYALSEIIITVTTKGLYVFNDGNHMSEDRVEKLFKPYEKGTDGKFGLGLSIVSRIASRIGFKATARNVENGVVFAIEKMESTTHKKR